jgi:hypothetical protein
MESTPCECNRWACDDDHALEYILKTGHHPNCPRLNERQRETEEARMIAEGCPNG